MSDDKKRPGSVDEKLISLNENEEVRYWTQALDISEEKLRQLVKMHGNSAHLIRQALGKDA